MISDDEKGGAISPAMTELEAFANEIRGIVGKAGLKLQVVPSYASSFILCHSSCTVRFDGLPANIRVFDNRVGICRDDGPPPTTAVRQVVSLLNRAGYHIQNIDPAVDSRSDVKFYHAGHPIDIPRFEREHARRLSDRIIKLGFASDYMRVFDDGRVITMSPRPFPDAFMCELKAALTLCPQQESDVERDEERETEHDTEPACGVRLPIPSSSSSP